MLNSVDLKAFITSHNIPAQLVRPRMPSATVSDAAEAMQVDPKAIIKSVLFIIRRSEPLLIVTNGERRISQRAIADRLEVGKRQVKIATPDEVMNWTGYPVGGVPPIGHQQSIPTWIDPGVLEQDTVYGGGGATDALLEIRSSDLLAQTGAEVVAVCA